MDPLNDDELNSLLRQAKGKAPAPSPELAARTLRAYRETAGRATMGQRLWRPIAIPAPLAALAAILLLLAGIAGGRYLGTAKVEERTQIAASPATLTLKELKPVRQVRPRVVRSIHDDQ